MISNYVRLYSYSQFNKKYFIDGVTHSVHQGPRCAMCIIQYGPREKWEERGTGQNPRLLVQVLSVLVPTSRDARVQREKERRRVKKQLYLSV